MSFVMLSPPNGIVFVYIKSLPSNTPSSVFPAPISINKTLSVNSLASNIRFLSAKLTGINPSISMSIFLNMLAIFLIYSLSANIT